LPWLPSVGGGVDSGGGFTTNLMNTVTSNPLDTDLDPQLDSDLLNFGYDEDTAVTGGNVPPGTISTTTSPNQPMTYARTLTKNIPTHQINNKVIHTIGTREERLADLEIQNEASFNHQNQPNHYNIIFPGIDISRDINVFKLEKELNVKLHKPKISKHSRNALLIEISSDHQRTTLLKIKKILDFPVTIQPDPILSTIRGTVKSKAMTYLTSEELTEKLAPQGVSNVLRINDTNVFIITFKTSTLPSLLKLTDWHFEPIETYAPAPMRCKKCSKLGHTRNQCRSEQEVCPRCSKTDHSVAECTGVAFCVNCGENHPSSDSSCPHYQMRKQMLKVQLTERISFREAKSKVRVEYARAGRKYIFEVNPPASRQPNNHIDESELSSTNPANTDLNINEIREKPTTPNTPDGNEINVQSTEENLEKETIKELDEDRGEDEDGSKDRSEMLCDAGSGKRTRSKSDEDEGLQTSKKTSKKGNGKTKNFPNR